MTYQTSDFERQLKEDKLENSKWHKFDELNIFETPTRFLIQLLGTWSDWLKLANRALQWLVKSLISMI